MYRLYSIGNWLTHNPIMEMVYILFCIRILSKESKVLDTYCDEKSLAIRIWFRIWQNVVTVDINTVSYSMK